MAFKPLFYLGVLASAVIVGNEMNLKLRRGFRSGGPCNGVARTRNPAWLSAPAVRNGGACAAAIRAARMLKHMPAPRSRFVSRLAAFATDHLRPEAVGQQSRIQDRGPCLERVKVHPRIRRIGFLPVLEPPIALRPNQPEIDVLRPESSLAF